MQNMVLAAPNDSALLTGSSSPAGLPISNLQNRAIKQVWRTTPSAYVEIDFQSTKSLNLFALLAHTGSSRSYARVRCATTQAALISAPGYDSGNLPGRSHQSGYDAAWAEGVADEQAGALETNHFILFLTTPITARWVRIDFIDPLASYVDFGRLYSTRGFQPLTNMDYGLQEGLVDPSKVSRTVSGRISVNDRPKRRTSAFSLSFLKQIEAREPLFDLEYWRGASKDVLFMPDPDDRAYLQKRTIYGFMSNLNPTISAAYSIFAKQINIEEITA